MEQPRNHCDRRSVRGMHCISCGRLRSRSGGCLGCPVATARLQERSRKRGRPYLYDWRCGDRTGTQSCQRWHGCGLSSWKSKERRAQGFQIYSNCPRICRPRGLAASTETMALGDPAMFKKQAELAYCKPSLMALVGRFFIYLLVGFGMGGGETEGPGGTVVRHCRRHSIAISCGDVLPDGETWWLSGPVSQQEFVAGVAYPMSALRSFRIVPGAHMELLDCSRNGFRKAHFRVETDTGEWRELLMDNRELEIMSKCLKLIRVLGETR